MGVLAKIGWFFDRFCIYCILAFLAVTSLCSLIVTAYLPLYDYHVAFSYLTAPIVIIAAGALVAFMCTKFFRHALEKCSAKHLLIALIVYTIILGIAWVVLARVWPDWDSLDIEYAAREFDASGDSFSFAPDSYISRFQHQIPFMLLIKTYILLFGSHSYHAFEITNVVAVAFTFFTLYKFTRLLFEDERVVKIELLLSFFFLPLIFYCTFQYANLVVLPFCIGAFYFQFRHIKGSGLRYAVIAVLLALVAVLLKSSMLLMLVAMAVVWIVHALRERKLRELMAVVILICCYLCSHFAVNAFAQRSMGLDPQNAMPNSAWVVMGLQKTPGMEENYGWYNGYIWKWDDEDYNVPKIKEEASKDIQTALEGFASDPAYAATFFSKKYFSEWCMPDYESLLASNWISSSDSNIKVMAERPMSPLLHSIYYGPVHDFIIWLLDCYQFVLVAGALIWAFAARKRGIEYGAALLACAGTALFYLSWEAQSQYVMHAYVFMIPHAAAGLQELVNLIQRRRGLADGRAPADAS